MTFPRGIGMWIGLLSCCWLCGCLPLPDHDSEEKNPLIVDARAKKTAYNFQGAVASLEKALEGNPRLALAHWELGLIYCQQLPDPAAAIYHFRKLLKLRPDWRHAETARQKIKDCQIELAKNVPLGPQVPAIQQQFDLLIGKVHELEKENGRLRTVNQGLTVQAQQFQAEVAQLKEHWRAASTALSNPAPGALVASNTVVAPPPRPDPAGGVATPRSSTTEPRAEPRRSGGAAPAAGARLHTVKSGETLHRIAQRYGMKVRTLVLANPNVNPERLKPGQVIRIPEP